MQTRETATKPQSPNAARRRLAALKTLRDEVRVDLNLAKRYRASLRRETGA